MEIAVAPQVRLAKWGAALGPEMVESGSDAVKKLIRGGAACVTGGVVLPTEPRCVSESKLAGIGDWALGHALPQRTAERGGRKSNDPGAEPLTQANWWPPHRTPFSISQPRDRFDTEHDNTTNRPRYYYLIFIFMTKIYFNHII